MTKKAKQNLYAYIMVLPAVIVVLTVVAFPILNSIRRSFAENAQGGWTLEHYQYLFTTPSQLTNIWFTLGVVVITALLSTVLAYALAMYLRFVKSKISRLIGALYLIPRFIPGMVAVNAFLIVIKDTGVLTRIATALGSDWRPGLMYNPSGLIIMSLWFNIPFSAMIIASALSGIQDSIIEGARDVGAGKFLVFRKMILPLSIKDVMVAATFVFMGNVGGFTTPFMIMGSVSPKMLGVSLYDQFTRFMRPERAAAISVVMFLICSVSAVTYIYTNLKENEWEK